MFYLAYSCELKLVEATCAAAQRATFDLLVSVSLF